MAQRFQNPFPEWIAHTVARLEGYKLFFYASGTSTKLDTYKVAALTGGQQNNNPMVLDEFGRPEFSIFLQNVDYKVILATPTAADPPTGSDIIWTADPVRASDFASFPIFTIGSGNPTGSVAGTAASSGVQPTMYWDYTNNILYVCTTTGAAADAVWTALNQASTVAVPPPQGRLTLASGTPVMTTSASAATTVYYAPNVGNLVPIYNGATFSATEFTELSLTLASQHVANAIYDIFVFSNSGVLTLVTGPAWATATAGAGARGTGAGTTQLTRVRGLLTNAVSMTGRNGATTYSIGANLATYLGSIFMDGSNGQVTCNMAYGQSRKWGLWNAYNRVPIVMQAGDATASWTYNTATTRASRGDSTNKITTFFGLAEEPVSLRFNQQVAHASTTNEMGIAIGLNSTTTPSGLAPVFDIDSSRKATLTAVFVDTPKLGINAYQMLEKANGSGTTTFSGTSASMVMTADFRA